MNEQERKEFERWYEGHCLPGEADWFRRDPDEPDEYKHGHTSEAWAGWQARAALAAKVPAGYKLVPIEPTEGILRALTDPFIAINGDNRKAFAKAWAAMLAATPAPAPEAEPAQAHCQSCGEVATHEVGSDRTDVFAGYYCNACDPMTAEPVKPAPAQAQQPRLLPCPFCGSHVIAREGYHMTCLTCGAEGTEADEATDKAAAAAWNRRAKAKPEAQQPLTEEDILDIARYWSNKHFVDGAARFLIDFARGIEERHCIGASGEASK